jgi:mersacidin/lichenicidin family type 2 lantibiotic
MKMDIVRAWKDKLYRESLSTEERTWLPAHPAGAIEMTNEDLGIIVGGVFSKSTIDTCCATSCQLLCVPPSAVPCTQKCC